MGRDRGGGDDPKACGKDRGKLEKGVPSTAVLSLVKKEKGGAGEGISTAGRLGKSNKIHRKTTEAEKRGGCKHQQ